MGNATGSKRLHAFRIYSVWSFLQVRYVVLPGRGAFVHSFHTVVISRSGHLVANVEGNSFTAQQLGDLVEVVAKQSHAEP
jgi:hypothetical protein